MLQLRPYQRKAVDAPFAYFQEHAGNPLIVVPTGGGKSLIIGTFVREALERYPRTRVLILQHVQELIEQNYHEMRQLWPEAPAGIYSAGIGLRQIGAQVLFGGIQSLRGKSADVGHVDLVLIDEAHMIPRSSDATYQTFLRELASINPFLKVIGFTATPFRLDSGMLHKGDGAMFDHIAYEVPIRMLFDDGFLCPLITPRDLGDTANLPQIDTSKVKTQAGEFRVGELDSAAADPSTVLAVCDAIEQHGHDRAGWLVFGSGTQHCEALHAGLAARGHAGGAIFGNTPKPERKRTIDAFKSRELRYLVSLGVLTTGFNARHVDLLACARPTKSTVLYIQMLGRGTRCVGANVTESIAAGKANCLVLDFGGNIDRHGPIDAPRLKKMEPGEAQDREDVPMRACSTAPLCPEMNPIGLRCCARCGAPYPDPETLIATAASNAAIMSTPGMAEGAAEWVPVDNIIYARHDKIGSKPSLRVTYRSGLSRYDEWVLLEHEGFPRDKACRWWRKRSGARQTPGTVTDALALSPTLRVPSQIAIKKNAKTDMLEVVGVQFGAAGSVAAE